MQKADLEQKVKRLKTLVLIILSVVKFEWKWKLILVILLLRRIRELKNEIPVEPRATREYVRRSSPKTSLWWKHFWVDEDQLYSRGGYRSYEFRRMFRMTRKTLIEFVEICRPYFPHRKNPVDALGKEGAPLELLIMGALSVLAGNTSFLGCSAPTNIAESTHRGFFHEFIKFGKENLYPRFVKYPETEEEIREAMRPYTEAGFPGTIGCVDGVRVRNWNCRFEHKWKNTGKEGYTTRVFQMSVGSRGQVYYTTLGFNGSSNDETVTNEGDEFLSKIKNKDIYSEVEYTLYDPNGTPTVLTGVWILADGGYPDSHGWHFLQAPWKLSVNQKKSRWSRMAESLRKDGKFESCFLPESNKY